MKIHGRGRGANPESRRALREARHWWVYGRDANGVESTLFGPSTAKTAWDRCYRLGGAATGYSVRQGVDGGIADVIAAKVAA